MKYGKIFFREGLKMVIVVDEKESVASHDMNYTAKIMSDRSLWVPGYQSWQIEGACSCPRFSHSIVKLC